MSVESIGDGSGSSASTRKLLADLEQWWTAMPADGMKRGRLVKHFDPPHEPGEITLAVSGPFHVRRIALHATADDVEAEHFVPDASLSGELGVVQSTNRGAWLLAARGRILHTWRWSDMKQVAIGPGWTGVRFQRHSDTDTIEAAVYRDNKAILLRERGFPVWEGLLHIEAAWALSTGTELTPWLAEVVTRMGH